MEIDENDDGSTSAFSPKGTDNLCDDRPYIYGPRPSTAARGNECVH